MPNVRFTDLDPRITGVQDFVIRKRNPSLLQLLLIFGAVVLLVISLTTGMVDRYALVIILILLVAIIGWYVIVQTQRNRDLMLATEFQNALFSSALGMNHKFCMIIRRDGNVIYFDRYFQDLFPEFMRQPRRSIDILLDFAKASREDSEKIFAIIERGTFENVILDLRTAGNQTTRIVLSIEPILRPSGFILMRGREYIESRSSEAAAGKTASNKSSVALFTSALDGLRVGMYMADAGGNIIYTSVVLEQALGYGPGEIVSKDMALQDVVYQGNTRGPVEPVNYEGEAMLMKKAGGMLKFNVVQKVLNDESGKIIGCTAVCTPCDQAAAEKKKDW